MIGIRLTKPEIARNDQFMTNQTVRSQERYVQGLSNRKESGIIGMRQINPERARNDKYKTYQTGTS